jgi:hypothetical protein
LKFFLWGVARDFIWLIFGKILPKRKHCIVLDFMQKTKFNIIVQDETSAGKGAPVFFSNFVV